MQENEFEKKIAGELNELKLKPSEQVWLQVEERIRKKKKRRGFFLLFLLMGLALLGWWQWGNIFGDGNSAIAKEEMKTETRKQNQPVLNNTSTATNEVQESIQPKPVTDNKTEKLQPGKNKQEKTDPESVVKNEKPSLPVKKKPTLVKKSKQNDKQQQEQQVFVKSEPTIQKQIDADAGTVVKDDQPDLKDNQVSEPVISETDSSALIIAEVKSNEVKQEELKMEESKADSVSVNEVKSDSAMKPVKKNAAFSKWKWGFHFSPGISSLNENIISFGMNKSADAYAVPNSSSGGTQSTIPAAPSGSKAGFAFQLGGFVQKKLSPKTDLSVGLQYGYYTDKIHIGRRRDSVFNNVYFNNGVANRFFSAANVEKNYTNHYHFLGLPVWFRWQLNKNENRPFTWDMGFAINQMVATDALVYDTAFDGIYSNNKKAFHKTQFSLSTGLSWTILNKNNLQWNVGPLADFFITRMQTHSFDGRDYLMFLGIRSTILFSSGK